MQELNTRKENCRRFSAQIEQRMNCTQKVQRVRCCGRVLTEATVTNGLLENGQGRGRGMANGQGQGRSRCMANRQDRGQKRVNAHDQQA